MKNMSKKTELAGKTFGMWSVKSQCDRSKSGKAMWWCLCRCGTWRKVAGHALVSGSSKSCGCISRQLQSDARKTHGMTKTPEFDAWCSIKKRCLNPKHKAFKHYGARGITICDRWKNSFENFITDIGRRPEGRQTIERINNDLGYSKENCVWAGYKAQANNRRCNHKITIGSETKTLSEWAAKSGVNYATIFSRVSERGWDAKRAIFTPSRMYRRKSSITFKIGRGE